MITPYSPARATRSLLVHMNTLSSIAIGNPVVDGGVYADYERTVQAGSVPDTVTRNLTDPYVPPDAAILQSSGYDEIVIDVQPVVVNANDIGSVNPVTAAAFRSAVLTDRPFWIVVRTDGYSAYSTRSLALACALNVVIWATEHLYALQATDRLRGFAFLNPDLNVMFNDGSVIDRLFQNQLVQQCWSYGLGAMFITSRPGDATGLIGPALPSLPPNPNTGASLQWPVIGSNPAARDRLAVTYPWPASAGQMPSLVSGMLAGMLGARGRDPGFPLNMDYAFLTPVDETIYGSDAVMGVTDVIGDTLPRLHAFAASLGIITLGLVTRNTIQPPESYLPPDAGVNTTGSVRVNSMGGIITVSYPDGSAGTVTRLFDSQFNELASGV